ncbi:MAG: patatin-like phospholipase family protein [Candidatus Limnocylindria bacterium]
MPAPEPMPPRDLAGGFTLALGGGGGRGWAHVGVARVLAERGLRPTRIVGTSMGAIIGAALAAGRGPDEIEEASRRISLYRLVGKRARLALFDPRPVLDVLARDLGDPLIEDLPTPLGITTFDLVEGRPRLVTRGRLIDALEVSIAVPLFFPPRRDADGVWCDAGPWEGIPVSLARQWEPALPVVGVLADIPKPAFLTSRMASSVLRATSRRLGVGTAADALTARRFLALLAVRYADPVVDEQPDVLIAPDMGRTNALRFGRSTIAIAAGERATRAVLDTVGAPRRRKLAGA